MPTTLSARALPNNTYSITMVFTDEDGNLVTPNDPTTWGLKDSKGDVINSRSAESIVEASTVEVGLTGDDIASQGVEDDGIRQFYVVGTYDSGLGSDLSLNQTIWFVVEDVQKPVSLWTAKEHLRVTSADDDIYISMLISSARKWVESVIQRRLLTQTITKYWSEWPDSDGFDIPYGNLSSVTSIKYADTDNAQTTWAASNYIVDSNNTEDRRGTVQLGYNKTYPTTTLYPVDAIEIIYVCGYGDDIGDVPGAIRQAILMLVSQTYEHREPEIPVINTIAKFSFATEALLAPYRLKDF